MNVDNPSVTASEFDLVVGGDGNARSSRVPSAVVGEEAARAEPMPLLILQALAPRLGPPLEVKANFTQFEEYLHDDLAGTCGRLDICTAVGQQLQQKCYPTALDVQGMLHWEVVTVLARL